MGFLKKLFKSLLKLVKRIIRFIKKHFAVLLIIAAIAFAPAIGAFLAQAGAPTWLSTLFTGIGANVTNPAIAAAKVVGASASAMMGQGLDAFNNAKLGTKASVVLGAATLISPETTAKVIGKGVEAAGKVGGSVVSAGVKAVTSNPLFWGLAAGAGFLVLRRK